MSVAGSSCSPIRCGAKGARDDRPAASSVHLGSFSSYMTRGGTARRSRVTTARQSKASSAGSLISFRFAPRCEALVRAVVGDAVVVADVSAALRLRCGVEPGANDGEIVDRPWSAFGDRVPSDVVIVTLDGTVSTPTVASRRHRRGSRCTTCSTVAREMRELADRRDTSRRARERATRSSSRAPHANRRLHRALERARQQAHQSELALVHAEKDPSRRGIGARRAQPPPRSARSDLDELRNAIAEA